jgi:hypothetical protein
MATADLKTETALKCRARKARAARPRDQADHAAGDYALWVHPDDVIGGSTNAALGLGGQGCNPASQLMPRRRRTS